MQVYTIQQWSTNLAQVALDDRAGATAFTPRVREKSARAPLHVTTTLLKRSTGYP